jgi:mannose-1-phosphate guanylyltransferase/mannose-6-phosphate isomerase
LQKIIPVILSGGSGTRLWPVSRNQQPKQFLPLLGGETMFQMTLKRVSDSSTFLPPIIVTGKDFRFLVEKEFQEQNVPGHILLEPLRRDSAAAIAAAAVLAMMQDPNALLLVMAVDHLVRNLDEFVTTVKLGIPVAREGWIVTFGIQPDKPSSAFGYIEPAEAIAKSIRKVGQFIEKPTADVASTLIANGCLWNSGNFLLRADVLMAELHQFAPAIATAALLAVDARTTLLKGPLTVDLLDTEAFTAAPSQSIDYAIMEPSQKTAVIAAHYEWSDLGSWDAIWSALPQDENGNVVTGPVSAPGTRNSLISTSGLHVAVVNLQDIAVIATADAVLVAPRQIADALKPLVAQLRENSTSQHLVEKHLAVAYEWGSEETLFSSPALTIRRIQLSKDHAYALKGSKHCEIHVTVLKGLAKSVEQGEEIYYGASKSFRFIGDETRWIKNTDCEEFEFLEVWITN